MAAMLEAFSPTADAAPDAAVLLTLQGVIERQHTALKFRQTKIEALNFEIARLKRWRFGPSSESLEAGTQDVLFDTIVADTRLEDQAEQDEHAPINAAKPGRRLAVRQDLPVKLPRIDHHHEMQAKHCAFGQALKRVGEDVHDQLDCVPAQFFMQRHI